MAIAPPRVCSKPGCYKVAAAGGRCEAHPYQPRRERTQGDKAYDQRRGSAQSRGYDKRWKKLRDRFLIRYPLCAACFSRGEVEAATEVDHIEPVATAPDKRLEWTNLQSLCHSCHVRKTAADARATD